MLIIDVVELLKYTTENNRFTDSSISSNELDDKPATIEIFEDYSLPDYKSFQDPSNWYSIFVDFALNTEFSNKIQYYRDSY